MLLKLKDGTAEEVCRAMTKKIKTLFQELRRTHRHLGPAGLQGCINYCANHHALG